MTAAVDCGLVGIIISLDHEISLSGPNIQSGIYINITVVCEL